MTEAHASTCPFDHQACEAPGCECPCHGQPEANVRIVEICDRLQSLPTPDAGDEWANRYWDDVAFLTAKLLDVVEVAGAVTRRLHEGWIPDLERSLWTHVLGPGIRLGPGDPMNPREVRWVLDCLDAPPPG
jgi:hypothetical protein